MNFPPYYQNPLVLKVLTYVDNFLTSKKIRFMNTLTHETGVSDHLKFIGTMLRYTFA